MRQRYDNDLNEGIFAYLGDDEENHDWILTCLLFRSNITGYYELISGDQGSDSTWVNLDFRLGNHF